MYITKNTPKNIKIEAIGVIVIIPILSSVVPNNINIKYRSVEYSIGIRIDSFLFAKIESRNFLIMTPPFLIVLY